ncbi:nickel pincer cofactor biosynthesis protein LarC [Thermodesulfatator autotrophicus]|uniref:Putative nickel insertion protein n=1 Tax=Thermodesulfatator autotrophicus TaxID=1795632 RepID=A0A177E6S7_9BACT|nr:nickel pincer cofactor biosynthesis protein LarC [Thermodesulfatator autotrophicus]OAG27416.1 hypothetical protein TH606_07025 [Thermodesulfatator autotrophicus]
MRIAYLDLVGGISGDMFLAVLYEAGVPEEVFEETFARLPGQITWQRETVCVNGLKASRIKIDAQDKGALPQKYEELISLVEKLDFSGPIKNQAKKILKIIFEAEAEAHGKSLEEIHLHELSAYDTLADIFGVLAGLDYLQIKRIYASEIPLGRGIINTSHGKIPVPAPATVNILKGLPVVGIYEDAETVTPTGGALLRVLVSSFGPMPSMVLEKVGVSTGTFIFKSRPNMLRLFLGTPKEPEGLIAETLVEIETNIDDQSPEELAYVTEKLLQAGALDVGFVPFYMKKGRPGLKLWILAEPGLTRDLVEIIFAETRTLGLRIKEVRRLSCLREIKEVDTPWGRVKVKRSLAPFPKFKVEFEDLKRLARLHGIPLFKLRQEIEAFLLTQKF